MHALHSFHVYLYVIDVHSHAAAQHAVPVLSSKSEASPHMFTPPNVQRHPMPNAIQLQTHRPETRLRRPCCDDSRDAHTRTNGDPAMDTSTRPWATLTQPTARSMLEYNTDAWRWLAGWGHPMSQHNIASPLPFMKRW